MKRTGTTAPVLRAVDRERFKKFAREFARLDRKVGTLRGAERWTGRPCPPALTNFVERYRPSVVSGLRHVRAQEAVEGEGLGFAWLPVIAVSVLGYLGILAVKSLVGVWTTGGGTMIAQAEAEAKKTELEILRQIEEADPETRRLMVGALQELRRPIRQGSILRDAAGLVVAAGVVYALVPAVRRFLSSSRSERLEV